jgi:hypothetical protein
MQRLQRSTRIATVNLCRLSARGASTTASKADDVPAPKATNEPPKRFFDSREK